jgi:hypothetical protein
MQVRHLLLASLLLTVICSLGSAQRGRTKQQSGAAGTSTTQPMSDAQKRNLQKLQSDLAAIKSGSQVTQAQKDALAADLTSMAQGATRPDSSLVNQLSNDLSRAISDGKVSTAEIAQLSKDIQQVLDSANISSAQVNQAISDAQAILKASGVSQSDAQLVQSDLKAIAAEFQKNKPSTTGQPAATGQSPKGRTRQKP